MKNVFFLISFLLIFSCTSNNQEKKTKKEAVKTVIKTVDYNQLKPLLEKRVGKTYVVNFWATWCAPCVKELPYFEKINQKYKSKNVEVLLVSLDFPKQVENKLIPFINKKQLKSEVILLDDTNEDYWIQAIDSSWSGALPATLLYNKDNRKFFEKSFDYNTLETELLSILN